METTDKKGLLGKILYGLLLVLFGSMLIWGIFRGKLSDRWLSEQSHPKSYLSLSAEELAKNQSKGKNYDPDSAVPVTPENLAKAKLMANNIPVIGGLSVPELGINLPITVDDGDFSMLYGAGPLLPNQVMGEGNYTLASHNMWTQTAYYDKSLLFGPLTQAKSGMKVYITDKVMVYTYVLDTIWKAGETDWDEVTGDVGHPVITLMTCDEAATKRIAVRGKLVQSEPLNDSNQDVFTSGYNQYWNSQE